MRSNPDTLATHGRRSEVVFDMRSSFHAPSFVAAGISLTLASPGPHRPQTFVLKGDSDACLFFGHFMNLSSSDFNIPVNLSCDDVGL